MTTARIAAAAVLSLSLLSACRTTQDPESGRDVRYNKVTGHLNTVLEAPIERVWSAVQAAVDELQFKPGTTNKDALTGILTAKTADNNNIRIRIERLTENTTDATVIVGPFGEQDTAREIMDRIKSKI